MKPFVRLVPLLLLATGACAQAQEVPKELPKDLHGRWSVGAAGSKTQPFDLENVKRQDDGTFAARLTWTTTDPRCILRYQPITGSVTATSLKFESVTPCGEAINAELKPAAAGWVGQATNKATPPVVMALTAK